MNTFAPLALVVAFSMPLPAGAAEQGDAETVKRLGESKHTLVDGIRQAEKASGTAISAKFEFEDGKLWLSVYTAKEGLERDAEHNTLMELKGEPGAAEWKPDTEVFADKAHLTRSAAQLTLVQLSKMTLVDVVQKAAATVPGGRVYSAIPTVKTGKAVVVVRVAGPDGKTSTLDVDLQSGSIRP